MIVYGDFKVFFLFFFLIFVFTCLLEPEAGSSVSLLPATYFVMFYVFFLISA